VRLSRAKAAIADVAERYDLPVANLLAPDALRRLAWSPPDPLRAETVDAALRSYGARDWQRELTAAALAAALSS
jgi:ribonuclease D